MILKSTLQPVMLAVLLLSSFSSFAQQQNPLDIATAHVLAHGEDWGLTLRDMDGMTVNDQYTEDKTGISRVFFLQRHEGIPVYNAIMNVNITKDGKVFYVGKRFEPNLATRINTTVPVLSAEAAVQQLMAHLGLPAETPRLKEQTGTQSFVFDKGNIAREDIKVQLSFQPRQHTVLLSWEHPRRCCHRRCPQ